ncbi:hypothetical protein ILUMI_16749 [Ignelater luminosus]|uniref:DUF4371 domain-containing protein n=1 Tax=Ignelater luminosus TaxID=2038154 RepID=A0A8K0G7X6_IGNLU|nr:hypothetical protein ILUMI_16749 [Ignelater luminosus]
MFWQMVERFLNFISIFSHTADSLEESVISYLNSLKVDLKNCRGQSYNNASNLAGKYNGLRAKIKNYSESAHYVPCSSHSLNLVGSFAADCCPLAARYFSTIQDIYTFFAASTYRWNLVSSDTRWTARADAIRAIINGFNEIKSALQKLEEDVSQKRLTQIEARGLYDKVKSFEFCLLTVLWNKILNRINATSKSLQEITANLNIVCTLYESLIGFVQELRNDFDSIEEKAKEICGNFTDAIYSTGFQRSCKRKCKFDDNCDDAIQFSAKNNFKINTFYVIP